MNICYTALFGNYEELKEPRIITEGWQYICYTDQPLTSSVWQIVNVSLTGDAQKSARYYKIMQWHQWHRSMWIDASFAINTDLNKWWQLNFAKGFSAPRHPLRNCVYIEALDCIFSKRGNIEQIKHQMEEYKKLNIPAKNGIIQSGILMRENTQGVIDLCEQWWHEVDTHSNRDQIAFAKVSINNPYVHTYNFDYRRNNDFIYHHHYNRR